MKKKLFSIMILIIATNVFYAMKNEDYRNRETINLKLPKKYCKIVGYLKNIDCYLFLAFKCLHHDQISFCKNIINGIYKYINDGDRDFFYACLYYTGLIKKLDNTKNKSFFMASKCCKKSKAEYLKTLKRYSEHHIDYRSFEDNYDYNRKVSENEKNYIEQCKTELNNKISIVELLCNDIESFKNKYSSGNKTEKRFCNFRGEEIYFTTV